MCHMGRREGPSIATKFAREIVRNGQIISQMKVVQLEADERVDMAFDLAGPRFASIQR